MISFKTGQDALQVITSGAYNLDWVVFYRKHRGQLVERLKDSGQITTATTTTIFTDGSVQAINYYEVDEFHLKNRDASNSNTVTVVMYDGTNTRHITPAITLAAGETLDYANGIFRVLDTEGRERTADISSKKSLGQAAPSATTSTDLYTVPAGTSASLKSMFITNRGAAATFRISHSVGGGAIANKDYLFYDEAIGATTAIQVDMMGFAAATDKIRVYASTADLSFNLYGEEYT